MDSSMILEVEGVSKKFPGVLALDNVSLYVKKGEVHAIVGENGAGKSTLMKILSGVYTKDSGSIKFCGEEMSISNPKESMELGIAIVYQEFNLVNKMTVGENIFLGRFRGMGGMREVHRKARELLDRINCNVDTRAYVSELSISQKQMVEIAKALSYDTKLVIMDEPSTTLTAEEMEKLVNIIHTLRDRGISVIYISHRLNEIFQFCDRATVMRDGRVIATKDVADLERNEMISMMVGRSIENEYPARAECVGEDIVMQVKDLNTNKLKNVSFELKKGEILGFVGLMGSGRSEIVRAVFGADRKKSGEIFIDGKPVNIKTPIDAINAGLALLTEDRKGQGLILKFPVIQNITLAAIPRFTKKGILNKKAEVGIAEKQVKDLHVKTPKLTTKVNSLSGGNQQKCVFGRWLSTDPKVLFLDEPTRGIDVGAKYEIYLLIRKLAEAGNSVIMISSELDEVLNLSNRVLVISDGRIVAEADPRVQSSEDIMSNILT